MKAKSSPVMEIVKREDKQNKLTDFIFDQLAQLDQKGLCGAGHELQLVALSASSPVIGALKAVASSRDTSNICLRIILADMQKTHVFQELSGLPLFTVKWARNYRLLDAHEQLVISDASCWIGDCMRREPGKRDAFECFVDNCQQTSAWAKVSFERLWAISSAVVPPEKSDDTDVDAFFSLPLQAVDQKTTTVVGTRH